MRTLDWPHNNATKLQTIQQNGQRVVAIDGNFVVTYENNILNIWIWNKRRDDLTFFDRCILEGDENKEPTKYAREAIRIALQN